MKKRVRKIWRGTGELTSGLLYLDRTKKSGPFPPGCIYRKVQVTIRALEKGRRK